MTHLSLDKVLGDLPGAKKDGAAYLLSEEHDVTIYASLGEEVLQIARASRVELSGDLAVVLTHKGERYYIAADRVVALKTGNVARTAAGSAGFRA
jgi:hypothetical protein